MLNLEKPESIKFNEKSQGTKINQHFLYLTLFLPNFNTDKATLLASSNWEYEKTVLAT
jgi:hypothetical protein